MNKKILLVIIILVILAIISGLAFLNYSKNLNSQSNKQKDIPENPVNIENVQINGGGDQGGLIICVDNCGDGICQKAGDPCENNDNLNCSCPETLQDCPKDCNN
jgi:hypothetical protein